MMRNLIVLLFVQIAFVASIVLAKDESDEAHALQEIGRLKGKVTRNESLPGKPVIELDLSQSMCPDETGRLMEPEEATRVKDQHLSLLNSFPHVTTLNLANAEITDASD